MMRDNMKADLDRAMAGCTLSEAKRAAILRAAEEEKPVKKRIARSVLILAAACLALTATAFAVVPSLRELLESALGGFALYSQTVEDASVTDQGIEIRVVSAVADRSVRRIYLEVQDKTGDRLQNADVSMGIHFAPETQDVGGSAGWGCIGYDPVTRTALFSIRYSSNMWMDGPIDPSIELKIHTIQPQVRLKNVKLPRELLTDAVRQTKQLETGETVLVPGQTPADLKGTELVSLSSMGYDGTGKLHIQFAIVESVDKRDVSLSVPLTYKTKEINGGYVPRLGITDFVQDGKFYCDISYDVTKETLDAGELLLLGFLDMAAPIEGTWNLTVPLESLPNQEIDLSGDLAGVALKKLFLSPIGVTLVYHTDDLYKSLRGLPLTVVGKDGEALGTLDLGGQWGPAERPGELCVDGGFETPVDLARLSGIAIGYWMIPIESGVAGTGYWLKELPQ